MIDGTNVIVKVDIYITVSLELAQNISQMLSQEVIWFTSENAFETLLPSFFIGYPTNNPFEVDLNFLISAKSKFLLWPS